MGVTWAEIQRIPVLNLRTGFFCFVHGEVGEKVSKIFTYSFQSNSLQSNSLLPVSRVLCFCPEEIGITEVIRLLLTA